jgi:hypothetical protein
MRAFEKEMAMTTRRQACFCGQPGVSCSENGISTRRTTVKGTAPDSHGGTSTSTGPSASKDHGIPGTGAAQVTEPQVVKTVIRTKVNSEASMFHTVTQLYSPSSLLPNPSVSVLTVTATRG